MVEPPWCLECGSFYILFVDPEIETLEAVLLEGWPNDYVTGDDGRGKRRDDESG